MGRKVDVFHVPRLQRSWITYSVWSSSAEDLQWTMHYSAERSPLGHKAMDMMRRKIQQAKVIINQLESNYVHTITPL